VEKEDEEEEKRDIREGFERKGKGGGEEGENGRSYVLKVPRAWWPSAMLARGRDLKSREGASLERITMRR